MLVFTTNLKLSAVVLYLGAWREVGQILVSTPDYVANLNCFLQLSTSSLARYLGDQGPQSTSRRPRTSGFFHDTYFGGICTL